MFPLNRWCITPHNAGCITARQGISTHRVYYILVMPPTPGTTPRAVRIDDELWNRVRAEAARRGETAADVVRRALREHLDRPDCPSTPA